MRKLLVFGLLLLVMVLVAMPVAAAGPVTGEVVRIAFASEAALVQLAGRLDVWEVQRDAVGAASGYVMAYVSTADKAWLVDVGWAPTVMDVVAHPDTIPAYSCYRTIAELYAQLDQWAADYPDITHLSNIGYSYEGRPLKMLRLTNEATGLNKPVFFMMANIHGRELITPETAMAFIKHFLDGYGVDADVTWVLDEHLVYVLVSANPDGHIKNEPGEPWAYWRKNTHPYGSCSSSNYGADLNRNFDFKWGGDSTNPCAETYQGPSAASEPETVAVQDFVRSIFPDQRGPADGDAAPDDAMGVLLTLHSYSDLVLWPWGHIYTEAPNHDQLQMLGRRMASFNGYTPQQGSDLYPVTGATDDWSYGELGIASYTYEIGSSSDGFYPLCSRYDDLVDPNVEAMFYAAKVARAPYITAFGPHVRSVSLVTDTVLIGSLLPIEAVVEDGDSASSGQTVVAAEVYIDVPPWDGGTPYPLTAADGAFNATSETVVGQVATQDLARGRHLLYVRGRDADGFWGPMTAAFVTMRDEGVLSGQVVDADLGAPLAGVQIVADSGSATYSRVSDAAGGYVMGLYSDTYTVTASLLGYADSVMGLTMMTGATATHNFELTRWPWGTLTLDARELGTARPLTATVSLAGREMTWTAASSVTLELPEGTHILTATAPLHHARQFTFTLAEGDYVTHTLRLPPTPRLLVVDDDLGLDYETYLLPLLDELAIPYAVWPVAVRGTVLPEVLADYAGALWLTGDDATNSLSRVEQRLLVAYLAAGGRLFVTGQNIGADIHGDFGDFYSEVLHAAFVQDDAGVAAVRGTAFFTGITATLSGDGGAQNQSSPDVIAAYDAAATPIFTSTSGVAGLAVETDAYRLVYLAYGLEGVSDASTRAEILLTGLEWLGLGYPPARLPLDLDLSATVVQHNVPVTYTLALVNDSLLALADGDVIVTLPPEVTVLDYAPTGAQVGAGMLTWRDLALPAEAGQAFWWTVRVSETTALETLTCVVTATWPRLTEVAAVQQSVPVKGPPVYALEFTPQSSSLTGAPGASVTYTLRLTNMGNVRTTFGLATTSSAWPVLLQPTRVTLAEDVSVPVAVTVAIPEAGTLLLRAPHVVTVTVSAVEAPDVTAEAVLVTGLPQLPRYAVFLPVVLRGPDMRVAGQ